MGLRLVLLSNIILLLQRTSLIKSPMTNFIKMNLFLKDPFKVFSTLNRSFLIYLQLTLSMLLTA